MSQARRPRAAPLGYSPERWRDPKNYPPRQGTSMRRWAGEFLARNPDFQRALGELRALWRKDEDWRDAYQRKAREVADRFGFSHWGWIQFRAGEPLIYPSFKAAPYDLPGGVRLKGARGDWFLGRDAGWGRAFIFDLRKPIAPQLRAAGKLLKGSGRVDAARRAQRDRGADYQAMLRVLDARATSESWKGLAAVICAQSSDPVDRAKKLHARAVALRDGGYLDLAFFRGTVRKRS